MEMTTCLCVLGLALLAAASPNPQFFPLPLPGQPDYAPSATGSASLDQTPSGSEALPRNLSAALDPLADPGLDELLRNDVPRQAYYGPPMPPGYHQGPPYQPQTQNQYLYPGSSQYPAPGDRFSPNTPIFPQTRTPPPQPQPEQQQGLFPMVYRLDNLVIIANPVAQQACSQKMISPDTFPSVPIEGFQLTNRFQDVRGDPSKCTWAIIACCSSSSPDVRYSCFELLGCSGFFVGPDQPCDKQLVDAASQAVVAYYRRGDNTTATGPVGNNL